METDYENRQLGVPADRKAAKRIKTTVREGGVKKTSSADKGNKSSNKKSEA